jgi:hypothetical protein
LLSVVALDATIGVSVATSKRVGRKYQQRQYYDCDSHQFLRFRVFIFWILIQRALLTVARHKRRR